LWRSPFTFELCSPKSLPTKFEFVISLKTAKQIGVTIPRKCLAEQVADQMMAEKQAAMPRLN